MPLSLKEQAMDGVVRVGQKRIKTRFLFETNNENDGIRNSDQINSTISKKKTFFADWSLMLTKTSNTPE